MTSTQGNLTSGSGTDALAGYDYQVDVSVWLALELVLVSGMTDEMTLEPATQEDLEADLADNVNGRIVNRVPLDGYTLIVQAKRKSGDAWTPATLKTLLEHGSDTRISAAKRLNEEKNRYLLVTSAGLNGEARDLKVRKAGNWPGVNSVPETIAKALDFNAAGRLAVIANEDDERLNGDIERLLTQGCRVPWTRLEDCKKTLRDEARARIKSAGNGRWTCADLEAVIHNHDGYLASSPEVEHFVHPTNWSDLREAIRTKSAAIIVGQSGTGKTLSTRKLYDELRAEMPGLTRVLIKLGPSQLIEKLADASIKRPALFDIEDPWGRFDFDPRSRPWNDQLAGFFANATEDQMIIATSRNDVAQSSGALGDVKPWVVSLESENYGKAERQRLYRTRIDGLPRDLYAVARGAEIRVLDRLSTPLEIQKFFDALRTQDRAGLSNPPRFVEEAINAAHESAIERTVIEQIKERNDVPAAAVLWALLTASDKVTRKLVREIEDGMADRDQAMTDGVSPLVDFLVAARNLRQVEDGLLTYYHPRVEKGVESALKDGRQVARRTITLLLDLLVSPDGPGPAWGAGAAARTLAEARDKFGVKPSEDAAKAIDAWLAEQVAAGGKGFERRLELAARAGSEASNVGELARHLLSRADKKWGFDWWEEPEHDEDWYTARAADPTTKVILETFIEGPLITGRLDYPEDFAAKLGKLADGLTPAFITAARRAVSFGPLSSDDAIAEGALNDLEGFEEIVDLAVAELTPTDKDLADAAALHLDLVNDVFDEDHAQHLSENEDGYTAHEFLKSYVRRMRRKKGWERIAQHRHADQLRHHWLRELASTAKDNPPGATEIAGAVAAAFGTKEEDDLWIALLDAWDERFLPQLRARVTDGGGQDSRTDLAAVACLVERAPEVLPEVVTNLRAAGNASRLIEIALTLAELRKGRSVDPAKHVVAAEAAAEQLPQPYRSICTAVLAMLKGAKPRPSSAAVAALQSVAAPSDAVRLLRLKFDEHLALASEDDVRWALAEDTEPEAARLGIDATVRHEMADEVTKAVGHRYAHVAASALTSVTKALAAPLPPHILDLVSHRASPVRSALAAVLSEKPHPDHQPALMTLVADEWSRHSQHYGRDDNVFPIARTAAEALAKQPAPTDADASRLLKRAAETSDPKMRCMLLTLLAKTGDPAVQNRIFDLAVQPGRESLKRGADAALIAAASQLDLSVIDRITAGLLATRFPPVAATLAILLGWRGAIEKIREIAVQLATDRKRRVLLLLVIWLLKDRDRPVAEEIAAMLPADHPGTAWALGATLKAAEDATVADLGEPTICAEVLIYMQIDDKSAKKEHRPAKDKKGRTGG